MPSDVAAASEAAGSAAPPTGDNGAARGEGVRVALDALKEVRDSFRSAVVATAEEVRGILGAHATPPDGRADRAAQELGSFAAGRIAADRFAALFSDGRPLDGPSVSAMEDALEVLAEVGRSADAAFRRRVKPGADLRSTVAGALAEAGRAFGAARVASLVRDGLYREEEHAGLLRPLPFQRWSRAERRLAPALVIEVEAADFQAGCLADFVDGAFKVVLVVRDPLPGAPLARLVSPRTFVAQTAEKGVLTRAAACAGPAVIAWLTEGGLTFVHDPAGASLASRLTVDADALEAAKDATGADAWQRDEELRLLREWVSLSRAAPVAGNGAVAPKPAGPAAGDPADRLASWLLKNADLEGAE